MTTKNFSPRGVDLFGDPIRPPAASSLHKRFGYPPFSVLDARSGEWQEAKHAWIALGIRSELGRGEGAPGGSSMPATSTVAGLTISGDGAGRPLRTWVGGDRDVEDMDQVSAKIMGTGPSAASIFDPALTELCYRWFSPPGGKVLDPFAGGSVRGIVAAALGLSYVGMELRGEQVAANRAQWEEIKARLPAGAPAPTWIHDDARNVVERAGPLGPYDAIFTCPPYADLERYSDDPNDLSTLGYDEFYVDYATIIVLVARLLKPDRFATFVVGDLRDPKGMYRGFPADTARAFRDAGMPLYNDAVLITATGSLPLRCVKPFMTTRKLGKSHQNVLTFLNGDPRRAALACRWPNENEEAQP